MIKRFCCLLAILAISMSAGLARAADAPALSPKEAQEEKQLQELYSGYQGVDADYRHAGKESIEKWMDWKLGLRIHWGVYSMLGIEASWPLKGSSEEFQKIYHTMYQSFDPIGFNADEWMDIMQRGGIRYFTITTKHCDGFCLWPTATTQIGYKRPQGGGASASKGIGRVYKQEIHYSIAETPYGKDILAQLTTAARKKGIGIGFYYSHEDWYDPDFAWHRFNTTNSSYDKPAFDKASDPARWQRFIDKERQELKELAGNYGPIDDLSFDCAWPAEAWGDLVDIVKMVRRLQPGVVMRNRGIQQYGDYGTPEMNIPKSGELAKTTAGNVGRGDMPWQLIYHIGQGWSYLPNDLYKSPEWILATFIDVVAKGGNMQLGFGPPGTGKWQKEMVERLDYLGAWLKVNGEAIYKTRAWKRWKEGDTIRYTRSKDNAYVYAISLEWPGDSLVLQSIRPRAGTSITMLGVAEPLKWHMDDKQGLIIEIPAALQDESKRPCKQAYAFRVEGDLNEASAAPMPTTLPAPTTQNAIPK